LSSCRQSFPLRDYGRIARRSSIGFCAALSRSKLHALQQFLKVWVRADIAGAFTVVNINTITTAQEFWSNGEGIQLGESGQSFRTVLNGHLNAAGMLPTGWFGGYAVRDKD
jgi:hypothetical protein